MILADKIIEERKKNGWSQEELAEKLNVTRQSVSKWEGAQSVPDLQRILEMSRLFGVSTDYLLKDELEPAARAAAGDDAADTPLRLVSMEEARAFLQLKKKNAATVALATFLCVFGAVLLILCGGLSEYGVLPLAENVAAGLGMILLLICAAVGVALFIRCAQRLRPFAFLEEEEFETAYGVRGLLREKRAEYAKYWLDQLMKTAKEAGMTVTLSVEILSDDADAEGRMLRALCRTYPRIDTLELITEDIGTFMP